MITTQSSYEKEPEFVVDNNLRLLYNHVNNPTERIMQLMLIIIIVLLYVFLLCVPAFFFVYEKHTQVGCIEGCEAAICVILGFPGAILGYLVRAHKDAVWQNQAEKNLRQREIAADEWARKLAQLRTDRVDYYTKSPLLPEIIKFVTKHGIPYSIHVQKDRILVNRLNGHDYYNFSEHGIDNISGNQVESYALGQAINLALGNQFTLREHRHEHDTRPDEFSVILERPLKNF